MTTEIQSTAQLDSIIKSLPPSQLLVIDFHATWCGPCHAIAPVYAQLADKFKHVKFVKVDVDTLSDVAARYRISAMPTFKFLKGGNVIDELRGASPPQLQALVAKHAGPVPKPKPAPVIPTGPVEESLHHLITDSGLSGAGEDPNHPLSSIVGPGAGPKGNSYVESASSPVLLLSIPFSKPIKTINSLSIFAVVADYQAPKTIRLFVNRPDLDVSAAATAEAAAEVTLTPADIRGERVKLPAGKFEGVKSVQVFVADNQEAEETTRLDSIEFFGIVA